MREEVADCSLTRRQSWRRPAGGVKPTWKTLDTGNFNDGQEYEDTRLEAWLQFCSNNSFFTSPGNVWKWLKADLNGFRLKVCRSADDENPEEICMEDILGVMCTYQQADGAKESEIDSPHELAAYFRRSSLHASEDASDIQSLVAQVEAEYLSQNGQVPQATGTPELVTKKMMDRDFAILTTRMGFYRCCHAAA